MSKMSWPWNPGQRSLKIIGTDTCQSATYDFLLTFYSNHGPISYRFWEKRHFSRKSQKNSPPPCILRPCWRVLQLLLGIGYRRSGSKKLEWWSYRAEKEVWWYLHPSGYIQSTNVTDRRTDGQTDTRQQQRPCLRIASRGKKKQLTRSTLFVTPKCSYPQLYCIRWFLVFGWLEENDSCVILIWL